MFKHLDCLNSFLNNIKTRSFSYFLRRKGGVQSGIDQANLYIKMGTWVRDNRIRIFKELVSNEIQRKISLNYNQIWHASTSISFGWRHIIKQRVQNTKERWKKLTELFFNIVIRFTWVKYLISCLIYSFIFITGY